MTPSFTRGEYWLLEAVVELRVSIEMIASDDVAEALNRRSHGLNKRELHSAFMDLVRRGLIEAKEHEGPSFVPEAGEVAAVMEGKGKVRRRLWYGLTAEGARQWELFAKPNWDLYIDVTGANFTSDGWEDKEYVCADSHRLRRFFTVAREALMGVDDSSVRWDTVQPWQATYWKSLPLGHRVRFRGTSECRSSPYDPQRKMFDMQNWR